MKNVEIGKTYYTSYGIYVKPLEYLGNGLYKVIISEPVIDDDEDESGICVDEKLIEREDVLTKSDILR